MVLLEAEIATVEEKINNKTQYNKLFIARANA